MVNSDKNSTGTQIRSVAKALTILDLLAVDKRELTLGEISKEMNLAKSTVYGLLATMRDYGYIEQSSYDGKYRLGIRLFEVGNVVVNNLDVRQIAAPYLQALVNSLEETVHLAVLDKGEVLYIDKRESSQSLRIVSQIGNRLPAHCTGVGKALLAYLTPSERKQIVTQHGLKPFTKNTLTELSRLEENLAQVRTQGFALENEEIMEGLRCVAVAIRNHTGKECAAMSISGPVARLDGERLQQVTDELIRTGHEISSRLGYREP